MDHQTLLFQCLQDYLSELKWAEVEELSQPIDYAMSHGGKRVRALLCLSACKLFSGDYKKALPMAAAIEVFHNFTLLHDDIMDASPIRRGNPSVFKKYGQDRAILSGDMMLIRAYQLLAETEAFPALIQDFNKVAQEVCEGQQMDMNFESLDHVSKEDYLKMIGLKTSVLLAAALKMGALVGGASPQDQQKMYDLGYNLGIAFQIQDDFLDSFGQSAEFGKRKGGDIIKAKKTILYVQYLESLKTEEAKLGFIDLYKSESDSKVSKVLGIWKASNLDLIVKDLKSGYEDKASTLLNVFNTRDQYALESLQGLLDKLSVRTV